MDPIWVRNYTDGVPKNLPKSRFNNLIELFDDAFKKHSTNERSFSCMGKALSYKELDRLSKNFACYLQNKLQLKKGDCLAIMMPNLLQYPIVAYGALRAGVTIVNINPLYTARELEEVLIDSKAQTIVILENFATTLESSLKNTSIKNIIITSIGECLPFPKKTLVNFVVRNIKKMVPEYNLPNLINFNETIKNHGKYNRPDIKEDDLAFLQYTGGTTGRSKGAMLTHKNLIANTEQVLFWVNSDPSFLAGQMICPLPLYHIFALMVGLFVFFSAGCESVLVTNPRDMKGFMKLLKKLKFNGIIGVNTLFNGLLNQEDFKSLDFSGLKLSLGGGMAVTHDVAKKWQEVTGNVLIQAYGLTETSPAASANPINVEEFNGSVGLPLPSTDFSIRDENSKELGIEEEGEIWIKGPQVFKGYWNNEAETRNAKTEDGWFKSGDIGKIDKEGYVTILDRKKDLIIVSGFNVYPNEVEDIVCNNPKVNEAAAIAVKSEKTGESIKLFVVKKDESLTEEELISHCKKYLTAYKVPKVIEWSKDLPKTNVGKILRKELRSSN